VLRHIAGLHCVDTHAHTFGFVNIVLYDDCTLRNKNFISLYDISSCYPENKTCVDAHKIWDTP